MPATVFSVSVCGARKDVVANTGSGKAFRSSLPEEVSGNSSSTTMCAGTMYSGNHALNCWRTAVILLLVWGSLA
ncbi:hypothetical protein MYCO108962_26265 [Mycobacterium colombiense]